MRATILIVEDDAAICDVVRTTLEQEGYACRCAYSGSEACLLIEGGFSFDAAICDLMLPGATGEEVLAAIRAQGDAPVIVASAKGDVSQRVALLREGADDYLVKPFDLDELVARLEAVLRRKAAPFVQKSCATKRRFPTKRPSAPISPTSAASSSEARRRTTSKPSGASGSSWQTNRRRAIAAAFAVAAAGRLRSAAARSLYAAGVQ